MTTRSTSASAATSLEIRRLAGEARGDGAGAHDQRADAGQRRRDGVRQAEGQKVRLGIGTQDAERQHDEPRERAGQDGRVVARPRRERREAPRPSNRPMPVVPPGCLASARRITRSTAATAGEPVSAGGCSWSVACRISTIVRPPNAGRPASISNRMAPAANRSLRASTASPVTCSGAM